MFADVAVNVVAVNKPSVLYPLTVSDPTRVESPQIVAVVPTTKFLAIAAPPLTCSVPVCPVVDDANLVPSTSAPAFTTKSFVIDVSAI